MTRHLVIAALLAVGSLAAAAPPAPTATPDDWAPSTGKEMPTTATPDATMYQQGLAKGMALAKTAHDRASCNAAVDALFPAAAGLNLKPSEATKPVFAALAHCARIAKRYKVLEAVAKLAPGMSRSSDLALALLGQERFTDAAKDLQARLRKAPHDPFLLATSARLLCKVRDYAKCRAAAEATIKAVGKATDDDAKSAVGLAHIAQIEASAMLGDYATAHRALDALPAVVQPPLAKLLVPTERTHLAVSVSALSALPLGTYHLAGTVNKNVLELTFGNGLAKPRELRVEVSIPGVTAPAVKRVVMLAHKVEHIALTPTLLPSFDPATLTAPRRAQLDIKVTDGNEIVFESSPVIELLPRDYLPTWDKTGEDTRRRALHNVGAWVTPNDSSVEALLTAAKARLPERQAFSGPQSATLPQVQAIYDELKARGVSYVMDPDVDSDRFLGQRTRLPADVLASTNAQCLEGTLLFASALEAIGVSPIVVVVPGHAFVGWHASPKDGKVPAKLFVETTMVHSAPFVAAVKKAMQRVADEGKEGHFKNGLASLIEIKELRARGITAQAVARGAR